MPHRIARIRAGRHPHEILVAFTALFIGVTGVAFGGAMSPSLNATFGAPWRSVYFVGLAVGGAVTLWGIARRRIEGMLIERAGLWMLAMLFAAYSAAIIADRGVIGLAFALIPLSYTATTVMRCLQIGRDLELLKQYLADIPSERTDGHGDDMV